MKASSAHLWHRRLSHINPKYVKDTVQKGAVKVSLRMKLMGLFTVRTVRLANKLVSHFQGRQRKTVTRLEKSFMLIWLESFLFRRLEEQNIFSGEGSLHRIQEC